MSTRTKLDRRAYGHLAAWTGTILALVLPSGCSNWPTIIEEGSWAKNLYGGISAQHIHSNAPGSNNDGSVTGISDDRTDVSYKVFGGYQFSPYLAGEATYSDYGESEFDATSSGGPSWTTGPVSTTQESSAVGLAAVGRWPLSERWALLGRIGWDWWESKETFTESSGRSSTRSTGSDLTLGVGVEWDPGHNDRILYRAGIEQHQVDDAGYELTTASAGIVYRFP